MFITYKLLKSKGACHSQREMFKKHFPDGVQVTLELCQKYYKTFDFDWAAKNLLSYSAYKEYEKIRAKAFGELSMKEV